MTTRRSFFKAMAATMGTLAAREALPASIRRALSLPAHTATHTIRDVEHIVVLMQENRSFDHYFGHLSGVRGVNDRHPLLLAGGGTVWQQPDHAGTKAFIAPFHLDTRRTSAQCVADLSHSWSSTHVALHAGRYDRWVRAKTAMTMGYYLREDIPFHYALADAFTICDHYFCSLPGPTHPNRMFLMTGTVDSAEAGGGPLINNHDAISSPSVPAFTWTTYPERLERAGISWRIYQEGTDPHDDFHGNFGLNVLSAFEQYRQAPVGSILHDEAMVAHPLDQFAHDVRRGTLPQVSWLLPPAAYSEHPRWTPAYGATYIDRVLTALTANPEVWGRTVLFIPYDENDGFFDHLAPPQPPLAGNGKSTVDYADEIRASKPVSGSMPRKDQAYGLGPRVPLLVVSPWSRGGFACSQVFDHTSVLRFMERRFGVAEPNISAWRRTVCGDLTAALDFDHPNDGLPTLPDTRHYRAQADAQCALATPPQPLPPGELPADAQEPGTRPARPLPYELQADLQQAGSGAASATLHLTLRNGGAQGMQVWARSASAALLPRSYTIGAGERLSDRLPASPDDSPYDWTLLGANGWMRHFRAQQPGADSLHAPDLAIELGVQPSRDLDLHITNHGDHPVTLDLADAAYGAHPQKYEIAAKAHAQIRWPTRASDGWYDIELTVAGAPGYLRRYAGHAEDGAASRTDPAATAPHWARPA